MVKINATVVCSIAIAIVAAGYCMSCANELASTPTATAPQAGYNTMKADSSYKAKSDAPICETHDELVAAAYEYDGGHTPDVSGCTALTAGAEVKVLAAKDPDDANAVQINTQGHTGWTKSYYLGQ